MRMNAREISSALTRKGFVIDERDHHTYLYVNLAGKLTSIRTKISHGEKEIGDYLIGMMSRQCKISKANFQSLWIAALANRNTRRCIAKSIGPTGVPFTVAKTNCRIWPVIGEWFAGKGESPED